MHVPKYRLDAIETIGRKILQEYDPALLDGPPQAVPIETMIETKFNLTLEYHCLRKNGSILGETIFDDGAAILYDLAEKRYRLIAVKAGTILIDERLCMDRLLGRLRFTCAHELSHWVLHQKLYPDRGELYYEILTKQFIHRFNSTEKELLDELNMERSVFYDRKREALFLFSVCLFGYAVPELQGELDMPRLYPD